MMKLLSLEYRFIEPLILGDYPRSMRTRVGNRLPTFSLAQSNQLKGSFDFIGINHYTTWYANEDKTNVIGVLLNDSLADSGAFTLRTLKTNSVSYFFLSFYSSHIHLCSELSTLVA